MEQFDLLNYPWILSTHNRKELKKSRKNITFTRKILELHANRRPVCALCWEAGILQTMLFEPSCFCSEVADAVHEKLPSAVTKLLRCCQHLATLLFHSVESFGLFVGVVLDWRVEGAEGQDARQR